MKNSLIVIGVILALGLIYALFRGSFSSAYNGNLMNNTSYYANGGSGFSVQSILVSMTKLLILLSTLGLGYGIFMYIKETYFKNPASVKDEEIKNNTSIICPNCNAELKASWKCCPSCGSDKAFTKTEAVNSKEV